MALVATKPSIRPPYWWDFPRHTKQSRAGEDGRSDLRLLDSVLALWGARSRGIALTFWDPWGSRRNTLLQRLLTAWSALVVLLRPEGKIILHGPHLAVLRGEVQVIEGGVRRAVLGLIATRSFFIVASVCRSSKLAVIVNSLGLDPEAEITAYLSINSLPVLFGSCAGQPVVLHLADDDCSRATVVRHRLGLDTARAIVPPSLLPLIPDFVLETEAAGYHVLLQRRMAGVSLSLKDLDKGQLWAVLTRGLSTAYALHQNRTVSEVGPDAQLIFHDLPAVLTRWPEFAAELGPLLDQLQRWQRTQQEAVLTHGDYWLGNVLFDPATKAMTGIVDWETARAEGTPGLDAVHFGLMTFAMMRGRSIADFIAELLTDSWDEPILAAYLREVRRVFGLSRRDVEHIAVVIYFSVLYKFAAAGKLLSHRQRRDLLIRPLPVLGRWQAKVPAAAISPISG